MLRDSLTLKLLNILWICMVCTLKCMYIVNVLTALFCTLWVSYSENDMHFDSLPPPRYCVPLYCHLETVQSLNFNLPLGWEFCFSFSFSSGSVEGNCQLCIIKAWPDLTLAMLEDVFRDNWTICLVQNKRSILKSF